MNDLFEAPSGLSPRLPKPLSSSGVSVVPILAEKGALFGFYPTVYPPVLTGRMSVADWKTTVDRVNELWAPIVAENKRLGAGGLLSYTILAVPVHLHKNHKFRGQVQEAMREISSFLEQVNIKLADKNVAILFVKDQAEGDLPKAYLIEIRRE